MVSIPVKLYSATEASKTCRSIFCTKAAARAQAAIPLREEEVVVRAKTWSRAMSSPRPVRDVRAEELKAMEERERTVRRSRVRAAQGGGPGVLRQGLLLGPTRAARSPMRCSRARCGRRALRARPLGRRGKQYIVMIRRWKLGRRAGNAAAPLCRRGACLRTSTFQDRRQAAS